MTKRKNAPLGAASDDPKSMIIRAIEKASNAPENEKDNLTLRQAAELGWLAASSTADVVTGMKEEPEPGGFNSRLKALTEAAEERGLKPKHVIAKFGAARAVLHGECFHSDRCPRSVVMATLDEVKDLVHEVLDTKPKKKKKGC
jgi:hypothetical protein